LTSSTPGPWRKDGASFYVAVQGVHDDVLTLRKLPEEIRSSVIGLLATRTADVFRAAHARRRRALPGRSADMLAAMVVSAAISGARHALLVEGIDPRLAGELAASFAYAGMRHFDRDIMTSIDADPAPNRSTANPQPSRSRHGRSRAGQQVRPPIVPGSA